MSGIAGLADLTAQGVDPGRLKEMNDMLAHRGPDDAGYALLAPDRRPDGMGSLYLRFTDPAFHGINQHIAPFGGPHYAGETAKRRFPLGLAHRRLSVTGRDDRPHQPLASPNRRYWLILDGHLHNAPELRAKLGDPEGEPPPSCEGELFMALWAEYGAKSLEMLNGPFALALYDRRENLLCLARDRFGMKPLYYAPAAGQLIFASEPKAILASRLLPPEIDPPALAEYFTFQNIFSDRILFRGVRQLPPGHCLFLRPGENSPPRLVKYAPPLPRPDPSLKAEEACEQVLAAFRRSVARQTAGAAPLGAYLSGGMDSGSIVAAAVAGGRKRLTTFTCGFDMTNVNGIEQGFDERRLSEDLAYLLQTEHYEVVLHSGDMPAAMERLSWHMDDPRVGMCHQNWYVAKLAGKFVKVCLGGVGGDELFGGYPWRYAAGLAAPDPAGSRDAYFRLWHRLLAPDELPGLFRPEIRPQIPRARESFDAVFASLPPPLPEWSLRENLMEQLLHFEFATFLPGLGTVDDRLNLAHGVESRAPFLDKDLAELAFSLPVALKVDLEALTGGKGAGNGRGREGKLILRRALRPLLPEIYLDMPKQGFSPPDGSWYRGESLDYLKSILHDPRALSRPWFDPDFVKARLEEHFAGRRNHRLLIWSLLAFEWLQRHFCDRPLGRPAGTPP